MFNPILRRKSRQVKVGHVLVGGDAPVMVQSMTNTDTEDIAATVKQVAELARGCACGARDSSTARRHGRERAAGR